MSKILKCYNYVLLIIYTPTLITLDQAVKSKVTLCKSTLAAAILMKPVGQG